MVRVGFFPAFFNLGETHRLVQIARRLTELGGEALFFSHGGEYEWLAREAGFEVVRVEPIYTESDVVRLMEFERCENLIKLMFREPYPEDWLARHVENEIKAFREARLDGVVAASNIPSTISARALKIPLISVVPGTSIPPYFEQGLASWPDQFENFLTRLITKKIKDRIFRWFVLHSKSWVKTFNRVGQRYGVKPFTNTFDLYLGDVALVTDYPEYLGIKPTPKFPRENFIGPIPPPRAKTEQTEEIQEKVTKFLERDRSILVGMGSSGIKELILRVITALATAGYNVAAVTTSILSENEIRAHTGNVLLVKWVPDIWSAFKKAKLLVIHGGENTVHAAAYSGRPVVGIPMQAEQQYNLEVLIRHGVGTMLSKRRFTEEKTHQNRKPHIQQLFKVPQSSRKTS